MHSVIRQSQSRQELYIEKYYRRIVLVFVVSQT